MDTTIARWLVGRVGLTRALFGLTALGLALAGLVPPSPLVTMAVLLGGTSLLVVLFLLVRGAGPVRSPLGRPSFMSTLLVVALVVDAVAGGLALGSLRVRSRTPVPLARSLQDRWVTVDLTTIAPARRLGDRWEVVVTLGRLHQGPRAAAGLGAEAALLRVRAAAGSDNPPEQGVVLRARGRLRAPAPASSSGYDEAGILRKRGIGVVLEASGSDLTFLGRRGGVAGVIDGLARHARRSLGVGLTRSEAGLLRGVVLGDTADLSPELTEAFRRSGTSHILSVGGLHVVALAAAVLAACSVCRLPRGVGSALALVVVLVFTVVTGAGPPVVRSAVQGALTLLAVTAGRGRDPWQALLAAACVVLALDPTVVGSPGFQLSFVAVAGLFAWAKPFERRLRPHLPAAVASAGAVSLAAGLATAPLCLIHFGQTSLVSVFANLLVVPVTGPVMVLGLVSVAAGAVWSSAGAACNLAAATLLAWVAVVARWFARAPVLTSADLGTLTWAILGLVVGLPLVYRFWGRTPPWFLGWSPVGRIRPRPSRRARRRMALSLLVVAVAAVVGVIGGRVAESLVTSALAAHGSAAWPAGGEVRVLDVGQGNAVLVRTAGHHALLIDGGPAGAGLGAKLSRLGVRSLDMVIVTHPHADHFAGLLEPGAPCIALLVDDVRVEVASPSAGGRTSGTGGRTAGADGQSEAGDYLALRRRVTSAGGSYIRAQTGMRLRLDEVTLDLTVPDSPLVLRDGPRPWGDVVPSGDAVNAASVVTVVRSGPVAILAPGDAEADVLEDLPLGRVDVLVVSHHGSRGAVTPRLLQSLQPKLACISVGARNSFGHPDPTTLQGLEQAGVQLARTDLSGAVVIPLTRSEASPKGGPSDRGVTSSVTGSATTKTTEKGAAR